MFAQHTDGDIYMFLTETKALIVKHKLEGNIGMYAENINPVCKECWELLPKGYQVILTQD